MSFRKKVMTLYLPRATVPLGTILAIEAIARERGMSFGKAMQAALDESPVFAEALREVEGDVSGKVSEMIQQK